MRICNWLARFLIIACFVAPNSVSALEPDIVVPAYFYPTVGSAWDDLTTAAGQASITAILNPNSGPGQQSDANYVNAVNNLRIAGGRVIGYVSTAYGSRAIEEVLDDIDAYHSFYDIDGIFIDEMNNVGAKGVLRYYGTVYEHVKSLNSNWDVMGNPGLNTAEAFLELPAADRLVITEGFANTYPDFESREWVSNYDSDAFVHLVHTESDGTTIAEHLEFAISQNAGGIYITDDVLPNPWDRLPDYWQSKVQLISDWESDSDINLDGTLDCLDIDRLTQAIARGQTSIQFDLNDDDVVDLADRNHWLADTGHAEAIDIGDVNLDGLVDASDWAVITANLFTTTSSWCAGDLNTDGFVDVSDVNIWLSQRPGNLAAVPSGLSVPEPSAYLLASWLAFVAILLRLPFAARAS